MVSKPLEVLYGRAKKIKILQFIAKMVNIFELTQNEAP